MFTSRCRSYQIQHETGLAKPQTAGDDLIQKLTDALTLTKKYVENLTGTQGQHALMGEQAQALETKVVRQSDFRKHPLALLANDYLRQTGLWLPVGKDLLEEAGQRQIGAVELGLQTQEDAMHLLHTLKDAWEMIRWYRTLIPVKTLAVLRALAEPVTDPQLSSYHAGKAKLILVSIDQSLLAWETIIQFFPEETDDLLDLMALLSRLRRELETLCPDARAFMRPGLD
ncbi:hypothetical protein GCM10028825_45830 [Spirosoma agri]